MNEPTSLAVRPESVMDDPSDLAVASTYADALLGAIRTGHANADEVLEEFRSFVEEALLPNPAFREVLTSQMLAKEDKVAMLDRVVTPSASPTFANFMKVLATHDRLTEGFLPLLYAQTLRRFNEQSGRKVVRVTTARSLPEQMTDQVRDRLRSSFGFEPILDITVDPALIGGMILQVDDTVYDSSLRTRLKQLRAQLRQRTNHVIQSERDRFSHPEGD